MTSPEKTKQRYDKKEGLFLKGKPYVLVCKQLAQAHGKLLSALGFIPLSPQQDKQDSEEICKVGEARAGGSFLNSLAALTRRLYSSQRIIQLWRIPS